MTVFAFVFLVIIAGACGFIGGAISTKNIEKKIEKHQCDCGGKDSVARRAIEQIAENVGGKVDFHTAMFSNRDEVTVYGPYHTADRAIRLVDTLLGHLGLNIAEKPSEAAKLVVTKHKK